VILPAMQAMGQSVYEGKASPKAAVEETARLLQNAVDKTGVK
jgi:hypothetical protein